MKQKRFKSILAFLLVLCMIFGMQANIVSAQESVDDNPEITAQTNDTMSGSCGATENDNVTWKLEQNNEDNDNPTYTLTISGTGAIMDFAGNGNRGWNDYASQITNAFVEEGITYIGARTFQNLACTTISLPASIQELNDMCFGSMSELENIILNEANSNYTVKDGVLFTEDMATLVKYPAKKADTSYSVPEGVTTLGKHSLSYTVNLTQVTLPNSLKIIDSYVFSGPAGGESLTIPDSVTTLGQHAFGSNTAIKSLIIGTGITDITNAAFYQAAFQTVTFAEGSQLKTIEKSAFFRCANLEKINIPATIEKIGQEAFRECKKLVSVADKGVTFSSLEELEIGNNNCSSFYNCEALEDFPLSENTPLETIPHAFQGCASLKAIVIPDATKSISGSAFNGCTALENVQFGKGLETIDTHAFSNCVSLKTIEIDGNIKLIGSYAFMNCPIEELFISANADLTIDSNAFSTNKPANNIKPVSIGSKNGTVTFSGGLLPGPNIQVIKFFGKIAFSSSHLFGCNPTNTSNWHTIDMTEMTNASTTSSTGNLWYFGANTAYTNKGIIYVSDKDAKNNLENINLKGDRKVIYAVTNQGIFANGTEFTASTLATPTKANYKFLAWYDNEECTGTPVTTIEAGKTYYAKWIAKTESNFSFKDSLTLDKIYDGNAVSLSADDYTVTGDNREAAFSYQVKDGNDWKDIDTAPANAGTYRVKATVAEDDTYASVEADWKEFTISKADPTYTAPTDLTAVVGQTLADVTLPEGFAWKDATTTSVGNAGTHTFKITYTPTDTDNYNTVNDIEMTLTVNPKMETLNAVPVITAEDKTLTVGDTFNPLDGVIASDKEDGDLTDEITVESNDVDTAIAGTYTVTYKVTDSQGASCTKTIHVTVNPKMEALNEVPVIKAEDKTLTVGDKFDAKDGVTATDTEDGDITDKIEVISNNVDTSKAGTYEVTYKVRDSQGASVTKTITVTVKEKDTQKPTTDDNKKPNVTDTDKKPTNTDKTTANSPKTGDTTHMTMWFALMFVSFGLLTGVSAVRKLRKNR